MDLNYRMAWEEAAELERERFTRLEIANTMQDRARHAQTRMKRAYLHVADRLKDEHHARQ